MSTTTITVQPGAGVTSYTGRFDSKGWHRDGKIHSVEGQLADGTVLTLCSRLITQVATAWAPDAWPHLLTDRCARCARKRVLTDAPSHKVYGDACRTFGYSYTDAVYVAKQALDTDALELGSADADSRTYYFRAK